LNWKRTVNTSALDEIQAETQGALVEILRNKSLVGQLGATVMSGLVGSVSIPVQDATSSLYYVAEGSDVTASTPTVSTAITMSHKTVGTFVDITRSQYLQTSFGVEQFVRNDLAQAIAIGVDRAAFWGSGASGQPTGLMVNADIDAVTLSSGALTYAKLVEMESTVADANADFGALAYATSPMVRGKLKTTEKVASTGLFVWEGSGTVNGYNCAISNQLKVSGTPDTHYAVFGNWNDLLVGYWSALDINIDTITLNKSGGVRIVALQDFDVAVRRAASFIKAESITV
jgi:HK97 family phage major capsid protein